MSLPPGFGAPPDDPGAVSGQGLAPSAEADERRTRRRARWFYGILALLFLLALVCMVNIYRQEGFWTGWLPLTRPSWVSGAGGVLCGALGFWLAGSLRNRAPALRERFFGAFLYAVLGLLLYPLVDIGLDPSPAQPTEAWIKEKKVHSYRGADKYVLELTLHTTPPVDLRAHASQALYDSLVPGQTTTVYLHRGLLGGEWYTFLPGSPHDVPPDTRK